MSRKLLATSTTFLARIACSLPVVAAALSGAALDARPQRATLATDTATTPSGRLALEVGGLQLDGGSSSTLVNLTYGYDARTELYVMGSPYARLRADGIDLEGYLDPMLGLRHRFYDVDGLSLAFQPCVSLPLNDGGRGFGSGEPNVLISGIVTQQSSPWTLTGFAQLDLIGDPRGGFLTGTSLSSLAVYSPADAWIVFAELAGVFLPELDAELVLTTLGFEVQVGARAVLDLGCVIGLSEDADDFGVVFGCTFDLGQVAPGERRD